MSTTPKVFVSSAGAMGAAISARLIDSGCTVLTPLSGRSEASRARAKAAGVQDVSLEDIINGHDVDWILSILPPNLAQSFAEDVTRVLYAKIADDAAKSAIPRIPVFVDCNAVNPKTAQFIARLFEPTSEHPSIPFIDASIIGGPPGENYDPTIYASSDPSSLSEAFRDFGRSHGLKITTLTGEGTGVGSASALKMSYAVSVALGSRVSLLKPARAGAVLGLLEAESSSTFLGRQGTARLQVGSSRSSAACITYACAQLEPAEIY